MRFDAILDNIELNIGKNLCSENHKVSRVI